MRVLLWEVHRIGYGITKSMITSCIFRDSCKDCVPLRRHMRGMAPLPIGCWKIEMAERGFQINEPEPEPPMALCLSSGE